MQDVGHAVSTFGLNNQGLKDIKTAYWNMSASRLVEMAIARGEGNLARGGSLVTLTGQHTGRSPHDRFIVEDDETRDEIWWGDVNRPISSAHFDNLYEKMLAHYKGKDAFVQDCYAGADTNYRLPVRLVTENAWHNLFVRNMFIQPDGSELGSFEPSFTVLQAPSLLADPEADGTTSGTFIVVNLAKRLVLIGGSAYAGEMKKSIFSIMNFLLPPRDVLPMHCSANVGSAGDSAIFFGLSGTGKTTLSADSSRTLIGDDEHGWSPDGIFNFEGGCYAKTINLTLETEPEIFETTRTFGSIIENVMMDDATRELDFFDTRYSENGRVAYDISQIPNASETGMTGHPKNIVMLTCDAFGVLPPVSQLTSDQAMYHFLSGYTAKVAGTERGLKEPAATFSTCFGAPFMPRHPTVYAKLLGEKMAAHGAKCWLVNTGWSGGGYGVGDRMKIAYTRAMVNAALDGRLESAGFDADPNFGVMVPTSCPDVPGDVLNPRNTWSDGSAYDSQARDLTQRFEKNFVQFESHVTDGVKAAAIHAAA
ncbi:MAG: phosphoenolpyruvate carboxykinase [Rhodospirillales bacterium]|nr:phosphoenolpyruvate carboxykinase [Rhodospirillales bacterium]MBT4040600.1 phosphoenolpyruvate carboxykinase [Rhodospirillales bacterium]MBT5352795.1 phosphoenolpyruvate carboxykinase [Rhodospirillales bacterium]MBT5520842.1 phosphoenolpyruvate carboxykinase [Rhodospirillales bacterium]MBT6111954.1 phosphoenolpyruvate carboxykinase [Rhodospirillales bacterium]